MRASSAMMMYVMIIMLVIQSSQAEVFSSVDDMKSVFQLERNIVMELLNLAEKFRAKLNKIQRYIRDFEKSLIDRDSDAVESEAEYIERIVGNPVHAFNLIRRFTVDIPNIEKDLKEDDWKGEKIIIVKIMKLCNLVSKITSNYHPCYHIWNGLVIKLSLSS